MDLRNMPSTVRSSARSRLVEKGIDHPSHRKQNGTSLALTTAVIDFMASNAHGAPMLVESSMNECIAKLWLLAQYVRTRERQPLTQPVHNATASQEYPDCREDEKDSHPLQLVLA